MPKKTKKPTKRAAKETPTKAVVTKRSPKFQLQFLFTDIDFKLQKKRELQAEIKAELEQAPGYARLMEDKEKLVERAKAIKEEVKKALPEAFRDLAEISAELEEEQEKFRVRALPLLLRGQKLVFDGENGLKHVAELSVRTRPLGDEEEEKRRADESVKLLETGGI